MGTELEEAVEAVLRRYRIPLQAPGEVDGQWDRGDLSSDIADAVRRMVNPDGCWVTIRPSATEPPHTEVRVWATEVEALRHALAHIAEVQFMAWGADPTEETERGTRGGGVRPGQGETGVHGDGGESPPGPGRRAKSAGRATAGEGAAPREGSQESAAES